MADAESLPFGLSWETLAMLIAMAVVVLVLLGNPQFIERIMSSIGVNIR